MLSDFLVLDPQLRDWVLVPIVIVMFLVSCFRHYLVNLVVSDQTPELDTYKDKQLLTRSQILRRNHTKISKTSYQMRKHYLYEKLHKEDGQNASPLGAMDSSNLSEAMKKNMAMIVSQILLMGWINYFFSGFVLVKLPFPLTLRFKTMLQKGIDLSDLDVTYVSSISWYFLNLFGLRGINSLVLGDSLCTFLSKNHYNYLIYDLVVLISILVGEEDLIKAQVSGNMGNQAVDMKKMFLAEREELDLIHHSFELDEVEKRLLAKYPLS